MSNQDEKRAQIIADQAAREAEKALTQPVERKKPRSNWAASPSVPPSYKRNSLRKP